MAKTIHIIICFLLANSFICQAQIYNYNTTSSNIIYTGKGYSYMIPHAARCFENSFDFHKRYWDYTPSEDVTYFLNDFSDIGNGGAIVIPWNFMILGVNPFEYTYDVMPANERFQWLMNHELTHITMCDKAARSDIFWRKLFAGKVMPDASNPMSAFYSYLSTPRWYSPRWYHEGIAAWMETWMSGGIGRVLGGYDEMVFRTMVHDSSYIYKVIGLASEGTAKDFQVGMNSYLYGNRFVSYLGLTYGSEKLRDFFARSDSSKRFYASQFKNVYGIHLKKEWNKWIEWEKTFQNKNIDRIKEYPITKFEPILDFPLGSASKSYYNKKNRIIYSAVNYPGKLAHIASINIDNGEMKKIATVSSPALYYVTSMAYDDSSETLFVTTHNNDWRGLDAIDIKTGNKKQLMKYSRTGDLVFNNADKSLWGIQQMNGRAVLVRNTAPYNNFSQIYSVDFGKSLFHIDISPNGKLLSATISDVTGKQELIVFKIDELLKGNTKFEKIYEFEDNSAANFVFSHDSKYLYGTSYYTGVSNAYRIEIATKKMSLLTNTETGVFKPLPISDDSLILFHYSANGVTPVKTAIKPIEDANAIDYLGQKIINKYPKLEEWTIPAPSSINIDSITESEGDYKPLKELKLSSAIPIIEGYKSSIAYGYKFKISDPIFINSLIITTSYSPHQFLKPKERFHSSLNYKYSHWNFSASWNKADFYDIFGPTRLSRAGYSTSLSYKKNFTMMHPAKYGYSIRAATYGGFEELPDYQDVIANYDQMHSGKISVYYKYYRKSLGALEPEEGIGASFSSYNNLVNNDLYPKVVAKLNKGFLLPIRNTSFWIRSYAGHSFGNKNTPFNNFYFGGFGNNYVDHLPIQRYRTMHSLPGLRINEAGGQNFIKITPELNLKPLRFKKLGILPFYATYARLSLFGTYLSTHPGDKIMERNYYSAGAQIDFQVVIFSLLKSYLSFGYGITQEKNNPTKDEIMISLKLL